jgi:hypothetical protein
MQISNTIDCNGLSEAPTVLRIKQALVGQEDKVLPIEILVGADCDCDRLTASLGTLAKDIRFVAPAA